MLSLFDTALHKLRCRLAERLLQSRPKLLLIRALLLHHEDVRIVGQRAHAHVILDAELLCHLLQIGHVLLCKPRIVF